MASSSESVVFIYVTLGMKLSTIGEGGENKSIEKKKVMVIVSIMILLPKIIIIIMMMRRGGRSNDADDLNGYSNSNDY